MSQETADLQRIKTLVAKHALCSEASLSEGTRLGEDLKLIGDDAEELLREFSEIFGVDMSGMVFRDYFPNEGTAEMHFYSTSIARSSSRWGVLKAVRALEGWFWKIFTPQRVFKTVTVGDLLSAARARKWFTSPPR